MRCFQHADLSNASSEVVVGLSIVGRMPAPIALMFHAQPLGSEYSAVGVKPAFAQRTCHVAENVVPPTVILTSIGYSATPVRETLSGAL